MSISTHHMPLSALDGDSTLREPLAVLLLSTDILRRHGALLTPELRREQHQLMRVAAHQLSGLLGADDSQS